MNHQHYTASHLVAKEAEVQRPIRQQQARRIAGRSQGQVTAHAAPLVLQIEYPQVHLRIWGQRSPSEACYITHDLLTSMTGTTAEASPRRCTVGVRQSLTQSTSSSTLARPTFPVMLAEQTLTQTLIHL